MPESVEHTAARNAFVSITLFIYERGGRLYAYQKTALDNLVKGLAVRTGIEFSNHTLRRTYGRTLWEANKRFPGMCPIETIAELTGHRDVRTTVLYLGINLADMADAMGTLAKYQELVRNQNLFPQSILVESGQSGISVRETYWLDPVLNHFRFTTPDRELLEK